MKNNSAGKLLKKICTFLISIKLTVIILTLIIITSLIATLIPQGKDMVFYKTAFPPFISWCILSMGFHHFFTSFFFIAALLFFSLHLFSCMVYRIRREIKQKRKKGFGPDIIHFGILLFIAGALLTFFMRKEESFFLAEKEYRLINNTYQVTLDSFEKIYYPDGRIKDWISTVTITEKNTPVVSSFPIEVNKSLEFRGLSIRQAAVNTRKYIALEDKNGKIIYLPEGHSLPGSMNGLKFLKIEDDTKRGDLVVMEQWKDEKFFASYKYPLQSRIGSYTLINIVTETLSGLQVVSDPGFIPIVISFFIIMIGLSFTFIQKIRIPQ
jgi:hypothetical protein